MARIRSIHPGQWSDDAFASCSPFARLLAIALRNFADDNGTFEWRPAAVKIACLPYDDCDVGALLDELEAAGQVVRYKAGGRYYGLLKGFASEQSPRKPRAVHPTPEHDFGAGFDVMFERKGLVGADDNKQCRTGTVPVPYQCRTSAEPVRNRRDSPSENRTGEEQMAGKGPEAGREGEKARPGCAEAKKYPESLGVVGGPLKGPPPPPCLFSQKDGCGEEVGEGWPRTADVMLQIWNSEAPSQLPRARKLTDARARKLERRLSDDLGGDIDRWRALVRSLAEMPFLLGGSQSGWLASLDWLAEPRNMAKVLDGNYRRPGQGKAPAPKPAPQGPVPWGDRYEWQAVQGHVLRYADPDDVAAWQAAAERWRAGRDPEGAVVELRRIAKRCGAAA